MAVSARGGSVTIYECGNATTYGGSVTSYEFGNPSAGSDRLGRSG